MSKRIFSLLLATLLAVSGCGAANGVDGLVDLPVASGPPAVEDAEDGAVPEETGGEDVWQDAGIEEDGTYNSVEDVSAYLHVYGHLPDNYITKSEARDLGWTGGSVEQYAPGCAIGGDRFGNREGLLPDAEGRTYYECDVGTIGETSRGAERIIFSNDGLIYYTEDHYASFTLLYGEE